MVLPKAVVLTSAVARDATWQGIGIGSNASFYRDYANTTSGTDTHEIGQLARVPLLLLRLYCARARQCRQCPHGHGRRFACPIRLPAFAALDPGRRQVCRVRSAHSARVYARLRVTLLCVLCVFRVLVCSACLCVRLQTPYGDSPYCDGLGTSATRPAAFVHYSKAWDELTARLASFCVLVLIHRSCVQIPRSHCRAHTAAPTAALALQRHHCGSRCRPRAATPPLLLAVPPRTATPPLLIAPSPCTACLTRHVLHDLRAGSDMRSVLSQPPRSDYPSRTVGHTVRPHCQRYDLRGV